MRISNRIIPPSDFRCVNQPARLRAGGRQEGAPERRAPAPSRHRPERSDWSGMEPGVCEDAWKEKRVPDQGLEKSFCRWVAGQWLAERECVFTDTGI